MYAGRPCGYTNITTKRPPPFREWSLFGWRGPSLYPLVRVHDLVNPMDKYAKPGGAGIVPHFVTSIGQSHSQNRALKIQTWTITRREIKEARILDFPHKLFQLG